MTYFNLTFWNPILEIVYMNFPFKSASSQGLSQSRLVQQLPSCYLSDASKQVKLVFFIVLVDFPLDTTMSARRG